MSYRIHGGTTDNELLDFSINVNPFDIPDSIIEKLVKELHCFNRYPDTECLNLRSKIAAQYVGVLPEWVVLGNGTTEIIYAICHYYGINKKRFNALVSVPSFKEYEYALMSSNAVIDKYITNEEDFMIKDDILTKITDKLDICFVCNPNNPTGQLIDSSLMKKIIDKCNSCNVLLIIDECFMDFAVNKKNDEIVQYIAHNNSNVIILNAFTKFYSIAGLRLGYAIIPDDFFADSIRNFIQPWNISTIAIKAGELILDTGFNENDIRTYVVKEREFIISSLKKLGIKVIGNPTADFILFKTNIDLYKELLNKKILIRDCYDLIGDTDDNYYRIGVRKHEDNLRLINEITGIINNG